MLVEEENLIVVGESIFIDVKTMLDTKVHRLQSWLTRLVRILLVLCFKIYWHLATFLR